MVCRRPQGCSEHAQHDSFACEFICGLVSQALKCWVLPRHPAGLFCFGFSMLFLITEGSFPVIFFKSISSCQSLRLLTFFFLNKSSVCTR